MHSEFEQITGLTLPEMLMDSLKTGRRVIGYEKWIPVSVYPLGEILEIWKRFMPWDNQTYFEYDQMAWSQEWDQRVKRHWCHRKWVLIGGNDLYNMYYYCDLDPTPFGIEGQIIYANMETGHMDWVGGDYTEFLARLSPRPCDNPSA